MADTNEQIPAIVFEDADKFTPYEGGSGRKSDLLSHNGYVLTKVADVEFGRADKGKGDWQVIVKHEVIEARDPANRGKVVFGYYPFTGDRSDGTKKIQALYKFLNSIGMSKAQIGELTGKSMNADTFKSRAMGKTSSCSAKAELYAAKGTWSTKLEPCQPELYQQALAAGTDSDPLPPEAQAQLGGTKSTSAPGTNGTTPKTSSAPKAPEVGNLF